jgi:hypothetical protein
MDRDSKGKFIKGHGKTFTSHTEESKRKISEAHRGMEFTEEHRRNLSEAHKGQVTWNKGLKMGVELCEKLSKAHKGVLLSEKHKESMSKAKKGKKPKNFEWFYENFSLKQSGENHPNWKGGVNPESQKERYSMEYIIWREGVYARDNWTCQSCGQRGGILNAHHIQPFLTHPELRVAIDNGIALCEKCHKAFHKKYGKHYDFENLPDKCWVNIVKK